MDGEAANKRRRLEPKPHPASLDFISSLPDDTLLDFGVVGLIDLFIHVGLCAQRCQLSHRENGPKIF